MYKQKLWYISICITIISLIVFIIGFIKAINFAPSASLANATSQNSSLSETNNTSSKNLDAVHIVILGDSIAKGTGDEKGKGIGGYLVDLLKSETPKDIKVDNIGVDGYKINDLDAQLKSGKQDKIVSKANLLIISIGGSNLQEILSNNNNFKESNFQNDQAAYVEGLKDILTKIRSLNKETQIIMIGSFKPSTIVNSADNIAYLDTWSYNTQLVLAKDDRSTFISTYDMFKYNLNRFISNDKIHPNSTGYQTIAYLISKAVENTLQ